MAILALKDSSENHFFRTDMSGQLKRRRTGTWGKWHCEWRCSGESMSFSVES